MSISNKNWPIKYNDNVTRISSIIYINYATFLYGSYVAAISNHYFVAILFLSQLYFANINQGFSITPYKAIWRYLDYANAIVLYAWFCNITKYSFSYFNYNITAGIHVTTVILWANQVFSFSLKKYIRNVNIWHMWIIIIIFTYHYKLLSIS